MPTPFDIIASHTGSRRLAKDILDALEAGGYEIVEGAAIKVGFDEGVRRYFVVSSKVPGLNIEAETFEEFVRIAQDVVHSLVEPSSLPANLGLFFDAPSHQRTGVECWMGDKG